MTGLLLGVFLVLHGLVHLLYVALSRRLFEPEGIGWSGRSWLLRSVVSEDLLRWLATIAYSAATLLFVVAGAAVLADAGWAAPAVLAAAVVSSLSVLVFWDGRPHKLADQGFIALLINAGLVVALLWLDWPL